MIRTPSIWHVSCRSLWSVTLACPMPHVSTSLVIFDPFEFLIPLPNHQVLSGAMAEIDHRDAEPLGDHEPDELEFHYRDPDKQKDDTEVHRVLEIFRREAEEKVRTEQDPKGKGNMVDEQVESEDDD
ncbi:hypothetical protein Q3G72_019786 [Acer saccharum]|nr:hypothetical protein Q3G72_019786 [Acer saccharum]